ncbi:hypothetical protein ACMYUJ_21580 [Stutzerimonas zhaodongensis]|uniref:hypothetical protein n=1 Tax=Stutzerimonas zhaodongensis TaxID=1176257 RepID=UPI0039EF478A
MSVGIPKNKASYNLAGKGVCDYADCILVDDDLYVLYENVAARSGENVLWIKKINLNTFDGREEKHPDLFRKHLRPELEGASTLHVGGNNVLVEGREGLVISSTDRALILDEEVCAIEKWKSPMENFFSDNSYFRSSDVNDPAKGYDIFDVERKVITGHLDCDLSFVKPISKWLIAGQRKNTNLAIFSIKDNCYVFELDNSRYRYRSQDTLRIIRFASTEESLFALCGDALVVVDLEKFSVVKELNYLDSNFLQKLLVKYDCSKADLLASSISVERFGVVLSGGFNPGYVLCLDMIKENPYIWLNDGYDDMLGVCSKEDIVFGLDNRRPTAWDKFTGEKIWVASARGMANNVQVGRGWLVCSQVAGYIACYQLKKSFVSPYRPAV